MLWTVRASRLLADAMAHYGKLRYTYLIVGWIPSSSLPALRQQLKRASKEIIIEATAARHGAQGGQSVPVSLRNPGLLGAFEQLVNTYARPRYEEVDPTVLMTITFPLLFGAMFGDIGQGLVLAVLGGVLAAGIIPGAKGMAQLGKVVVACGLSGTVFGFLYGSFFGFEGEHLPFKHVLARFIVIEPIHQILEILGIAIATGVVLLSLGFLLNIYNALRARDWARLFFDPNGVTGVLLYWSLVGFAASKALPSFPIAAEVFVAGAGIGALGVMFSELLKHLVIGHRPLFEGGLFMLFFQSAVELFEKLISLLSNTLSYVRVGAFAVVHAGLSTAIFTIAELAGGPGSVFYWIVVVIGNIGIILVEGLIVGIQTMRLHYYEFFSKFFTGGGLAFDPLKTLVTANKPQTGAAA
jgi:V/A-type H+-transporting ATPase subunit I